MRAITAVLLRRRSRFRHGTLPADESPMIEDMAMRGLRQDTQCDYVRFVRSFAAFLKRPPDTATPEDIRRFQVHQAQSGVQPQSINCSVSALPFFFTVTLDRPELSRRFARHRQPFRLAKVPCIPVTA